MKHQKRLNLRDLHKQGLLSGPNTSTDNTDPDSPDMQKGKVH